MKQLIPARVQPLAIPVNVLLPNLHKWYKETPQSRAKEAYAAKTLEAYNYQLRFFNSERGTSYRPLTILHFYYWIRSNPDERMRTPYLDEILVLASVTELEDHHDVLSRYIDWTLDSFLPAQKILD